MQLVKRGPEDMKTTHRHFFFFLFLGADCSSCWDCKFINVVHTVRGQCIVYVMLHISEMTGKALSYSLLQRITWPNKRKVVTGINSVPSNL